jgi:anti-anti-sigma regulatory factor
MSEGIRIVTESVELEGDSWVVLRVYGDPTGADSEEVEAALESPVATPRCRVCVRLEDAKSVDAVTIGVLVGAGVRARASGGKLKVHFPGFGWGNDDDWSAGIPGPLPRTSGPMEGHAAKRPEGGAC